MGMPRAWGTRVDGPATRFDTFVFFFNLFGSLVPLDGFDSRVLFDFSVLSFFSTHSVLGHSL